MAMDKMTDKKTIGITSANERVLEALVAEGLFGSEIEAAKFAMARAIDASVRAASWNRPIANTAGAGIRSG